MSRLRTVVAVAAALAFMSAGARAADMPAYPPPPEVAVIAPTDYGWYLRGDIGYAWGGLQGAQSAAFFPDPTGSSFDGGFVGGVGAGYKSKWLRTDLTVDYNSPLKYTGTIVTPGDTSAKIEAVTALINGYIDLGTWYHVTPYIGAGVGASELRTFDYASTASPPFTAGLSHTQWNFAWAATAGVGYAIAPNLMLDVNYRYVNFGDVQTASDAFGAMTFNKLYANEVRVGIRWSFDEQAFQE